MSDLRRIGERFAVPGRLVDAQRAAGGHINETFIATYRHDSGSVTRRILQRINTAVFPRTAELMENVARITRHVPDLCASLLAARDGSAFVRDGGEWWRAYEYLEGLSSIEVPETPRQAFESARAFGVFARRLAALPGPPLHETIPHFHDTRRRLARLRDAAAADACGRAASAASEIGFAFENAHLADAWHALHERLPLRTAHNDAKTSNVLFSPDGKHRIIDLDTAMPGLLLCDFGEMVRTGAASAPEDEPDARRMHVRPEFYRAIERGFREGCGDLLSEPETAEFLLSAQLMAFENGVRFLTDYLQGDRYFAVNRPEHNLDRARAQFALVRSLAAGEAEPAP